MSDSKYAAQAEADFRKAYPAEEGWKIFTIFPDAHSGLSTSVKSLPEFIEKVRPEWSGGPLNMLTGNFLLNSHKDSMEKLPIPEWSVKMAPRCWNGDLTIKPEGGPMVYRCVPLYAGQCWSHLTMIAYKSEAALTAVHSEIVRWYHSRRENREVIIVAGPHTQDKIPRPGLTWEDIILPGGLAEDIRVNVDSFFKAGPRYQDLGLPHKRGFLLSGPPGNGKTLAARIIASDRSRNFVWASVTSETDDDSIDNAFKYAANYAPSVLLFEDLDRMVSSHKVSMSFLLNKLDGLDSEDGILVMATSNAPEKLDPALVHRPSRFDRVWNIGLPGREERLRLLSLKGSRFFSEKAVQKAAEAAEGFSMAYTQELITNAVLIAANSDRDPGDEDLRTSLSQLKNQFKGTAAREGLNRHAQQVLEIGFTS
ncbi:MAG: ATP-binding protein [Elusimicrobiales bacterium]|nr:ATP-binding protein [Elusimicrobiales bacterium]